MPYLCYREFIEGYAMHAITHAAAPPASGRRPHPLAQVDVLLLFHPSLQEGGRNVPAESCARATQAWLTLDVYGSPGVSDLTGRPVMEDLRLLVNGEDIEPLLPDKIVNEVADYLLR